MSQIIAAPIIVDAPQRSEEWHKARLGKVTGSDAKKVFFNVTEEARKAAIREILMLKAITAGVREQPDFLELWTLDPIQLFKKADMELPEGAERKNYRQDKVAERLTGLRSDPEPFVNYHMKWGMASESIAINRYQLEKRTAVMPAPFMLHRTVDAKTGEVIEELAAGASPDGLVTDPKDGRKGTIECKCLRTPNHLFNIIEKQEVPAEYLPQIQMQMWITGREFCDFIGYDSRLPEGLKVYFERVERDNEYINKELEPAVRYFLGQVDSAERFFRMKIRQTKALIGAMA